MRPGITIKHATLPARRSEFVRCDILGMIALVPPSRWPPNASRGDFLELLLDEPSHLGAHPARYMFSTATRQAVGSFFENGGERCHLFGLCVAEMNDLAGAQAVAGLLSSLLQHLRTTEEISILVAPDTAFTPIIHPPGARILCQAEPFWEALLAHCREMGNRFFIMDSPWGLHGQALVGWVRSFREREPATRSFGAIYYPWLQQRDLLFPPSGTMAGVFARVEKQHEPFGVVWPPANVELRGITHTHVDLAWDEVGSLAEQAINPLVIQPGRGVMVWGARTLSRERSWRYINSRRISSMIAEQLRRDNEWAVFEPNDARLWKVLERDVGVRLEEFWRAGLLTSETRHGDYEIKCDSEVNPPAEREAGRMNVQVRIRPVGTTEHITIDLRLGESPT